MAYTKIKPVKHHLQRCLDYTSNPKKTEKFSADDLNRLLSYTQNQNKTEHQLYVTGFRCNPATAYRRMYRTKKRWNQPMDEGDILAYHIIQSFSPGESKRNAMTLLPRRKKYCRKLCRMASALPTICTAGGGLVVISHPAMQHLCCKPCRKRGPY